MCSPFENGGFNEKSIFESHHVAILSNPKFNFANEWAYKLSLL